MSTETRQWVCDRLAYTDDTQRTDLMNPDLTQTELIAFLQDLLTLRDGVWQNQITVTSVRTDHLTPDGPNGHEGGNAIDFWNADAQLHLVQDVQSCSEAKGIGLGGVFQNYAAECGGYSPDSKLFQDNDTDHIHVQVVGY